MIQTMLDACLGILPQNPCHNRKETIFWIKFAFLWVKVALIFVRIMMRVSSLTIGITCVLRSRPTLSASSQSPAALLTRLLHGLSPMLCSNNLALLDV